ncbi:DUF6765 family protein [Desulfoluna butyratoxydans]|uniref:Uncharacterized protein n=1 Tax=Desulfoluna butyratoxydans TaxID=231438 RepID=A0A4U8YNN7_9BACT|nr:DUF6765 family protein [Desulfoluna butyratoxydans]VFQ45371.1 hypothetical protein MSL71_30280 [Desulfoluna butyratoxydans]
MDRDFHFFGTFTAAAQAGFSGAEALTIATAAQFVDDCTESVTHKPAPLHRCPRQVWVLSRGGYVFTPIITAVEDISAWAGAFESDETRQIWMPFHYLPGNTPSNLDPVTVRRGRAGESLDCLCRPGSEAARELVNFAVARYGELAAVDRRLALMLVGICMHVFADTYAHQDFAGCASSELNAPSQGIWRNTGSFTNKGRWKGRRWIPRGKSYREIAWPWRVEQVPDSPLTAYSDAPTDATRLGHCHMGHLPDISSIAYEFYPCWADGLADTNRNNPEIFLACFMEMVRALRAVRSGDRFAFLASEGEADEAYDRDASFFNGVKKVISPSDHDPCDRDLYGTGMNMAADIWFRASEERWKRLVADTVAPGIRVDMAVYDATRDAWADQVKSAGGREMAVREFTELPFVKWNCAAKAVFAHLFQRLQTPGNRMKVLPFDKLSACMPSQFHLLDEIAEFWVPKGKRGGGYYYSDQVARLKVRNRALQRATTPFEIETLFFC